MSYESFVLVTRIALVLGLILVTAVVRTFIGPSKRRGFVMSVGMLGGTTLGVVLGYLVPAALKMQESAIFAVCGMLLGFGVAWFFARSIPRQAS